MRRVFHARDVTLAIPTFGREQVLLDTVRDCLAQEPPARQILVIDQTLCHVRNTEAALRAWDRDGSIRLLRREKASIPAAMNHALREASSPIVLFIDDDVVPNRDLVARHAEAHGEPETWAVVGQILQPGEKPFDGAPPREQGGIRVDLDFRFNSVRRAWVRNCMAGNLSLRREETLRIGGFDENFSLGVAYRFETEFARRVGKNGGKVLFEPGASLRHLQAESGGTRMAGNHLRSCRPDHSVGDYYFALLHGMNADVAWYIMHRLVRSAATRYHLTHPWWIPFKMIGELRGLLCAVRLAAQGQRLLSGV